MTTYEVYQVDSFTRERFLGNPAGVVPHADGLTERQMQAIARELNNSETAFVLQPASDECDVEVRFFTPTVEVPSCGHATIAAHYVRAVMGEHTSGRVLMGTGAGVLPVDVERDGESYVVRMTQGTPEVSEPLADGAVGRLCAALGIGRGQLRDDRPVAVASTGHSKVMVPLSSTDTLHALAPDMGALGRLSDEIGCNGYYAFTLDESGDPPVHGRMFAPAIGIPEDPVTGNANGPLGAYLAHYRLACGLTRGGSLDFEIVQGEAIGRPGRMGVHVELDRGEPALVQITGTAIVAFRTAIEL